MKFFLGLTTVLAILLSFVLADVKHLSHQDYPRFERALCKHTRQHRQLGGRTIIDDQLICTEPGDSIPPEILAKTLEHYYRSVGLQ